MTPSIDDKTQQVAQKMRDLMAVVEFDDTEEPTELDGEVIENVFGSVEDEPEHLEISLGGPSISLATPGTISGSAMVSIVEEVEEIESNGESEVSEKSPTGTNLSVAISDGGQSELGRGFF